MMKDPHGDYIVSEFLDYYYYPTNLSVVVKELLIQIEKHQFFLITLQLLLKLNQYNQHLHDLSIRHGLVLFDYQFHY